MSDDFPEATEEELLGGLLADGWRWSDSVPGLLYVPENPEFNVWKNPDTGDLHFSDKLVDWLAEEVDRVRTGRG
jgi:hypothetical protein